MPREKPAWKRFCDKASKELDLMCQDLALWEKYDAESDEVLTLRSRIRGVQQAIEKAEIELLPPSGWSG